MIASRIPTLLAAWSMVLGLALADGASAATEPLRLHDYFQESWSTGDGLPHNLVSDIEQTPEGYLWFATWEGLVRFNGHRFDVFDEQRIAGLPDRGITELDLDGKGRLLVGTARGGMARRDEDGWHILSTDRGRGSVSIYSFAAHERWPLIGTAGQGVLQQVDADSVRPLDGLRGQDNSVVYGLAGELQYGLWLGTDSGLWRLRDGELRSFGQAEGLPAAAVLSLVETADFGLIVGTERGAFRVRGDHAYPLHPDLPDVSIESLLVDRRGDVWVGTAAHGLYRLSALGLEHLDAKSGLPNNRVAVLFEDRESSIWVGTNGGLFRLRAAPFRSFTVKQGLSDDYVRALADDADGSLWIGTSAGLNRLRDGVIQPIDLGEDSATTSILSLATSHRGGVWIGTYFGGVLQWRDGQLLRRIERAQGLPSTQVRAIIEDADGTVWAGTSRGLSRIRGERIDTFDDRNGLPHSNILALHRDRRGRLWVGTSLGIAVGDGDTFSAVHDAAVADAQRIYGFTEDADGTLWVASDRGVLRWRGGAWALAGPQHGLPVASLFSVNIDGDGAFWLGSNRGVVRVEHAAMEAVLDGESKRLSAEVFTEADGMASAQCNGASGPTALVRRDGSVWFGTAVGVASIDPSRLDSFPRLLPAVVIEQASVDGVALPIIDESLVVPPGARRIELQFAGLSFQAPGRIRYRYRLEGFDDEWVVSGHDRVAQFTNLSPGRYRFRGSAAHPNGQWSHDEAVVSIEVQPQLWQRREVQMAALLSLLLTAWLLVRWRLRALRGNERRLSVQVQAATADLRDQAARLREQNLELDAYAHTVAHDLKTPLTTVVGLARLLDQAGAKLPAETARSSAARIYATAQKMAAIIDGLLMLSRARTETAVERVAVDNRVLVAEVLLRLKDLIDERSADIRCDGDLPGAMGYAPWIEEVWVNYLSNAIKYGGTPPVLRVSARHESGGRVRFLVRDNGPGLSEAARSKLFQPFSRIAEIGGEGHGLGLSIVRRIVERMGGDVGCDSVPGQGATFWFRLDEAPPVDPRGVSPAAGGSSRA